MRAVVGTHLEASEAMLPGSALLRLRSERKAAYPMPLRTVPRKRTHRRSVLSSRWLAWFLAVAVSVTVAGLASYRISEANRANAALASQLAATQQQIEGAAQEARTAEAHAAELQSQLAGLKGKYAELQASKVKTIVKEKTVTETVTRWVPNGEGIEVEVVGFEGMIAIHDVQLTHAYGYSDLIGIAVNKSGETVSYAQLGCSFLGAQGKLLASGMDNKQNWLPGQTWGFDCSAQVDATGGILRVDEMS